MGRASSTLPTQEVWRGARGGEGEGRRKGSSVERKGKGLLEIKEGSKGKAMDVGKEERKKGEGCRMGSSDERKGLLEIKEGSKGKAKDVGKE